MTQNVFCGSSIIIDWAFDCNYHNSYLAIVNSTDLHNRILSPSFEKDEEIIYIFSDVTKTFDYLQTSSIQKSLHHADYTGNVINSVHNFH